MTLQALLLAGAVLFIFCGCGVAQSALVAPAAAAALLLAARLELAAATDRQLQVPLAPPLSPPVRST